MKILRSLSPLGFFAQVRKFGKGRACSSDDFICLNMNINSRGSDANRARLLSHFSELSQVSEHSRGGDNWTEIERERALCGLNGCGHRFHERKTSAEKIIILPINAYSALQYW